MTIKEKKERITELEADLEDLSGNEAVAHYLLVKQELENLEKELK